jgi:phosphate-selective porin OprO/OprP
MVDTGLLASDKECLMGLEALYIRGPFSLQAEYGWNWVDHVKGVIQTLGGPLVPLAGGPHDYVFDGGYIQVAYTLTGENRAYNKRDGTLAREYYGKHGPYENAFLVQDPEGRICCGVGAIEIAARYSYVNLNDGSGLDRIAGGDMQGLTAGVNWYCDTNFSLMLDYVYNFRYNVASGTPAGWTNGLGVMAQYQF